MLSFPTESYQFALQYLQQASCYLLIDFQYGSVFPYGQALLQVTFYILSNIFLSLDMRQPDPKDVRVGRILFLPKSKPVKGMEPREGFAAARYKREACNDDWSMNPGGWGHHVIVVGVGKENKEQTMGVTISFVQVYLLPIAF